MMRAPVLSKISQAWWKSAVVYQIYPRSFKDSNGDGIGDINGIRQKIPYLKDLGVDVIWLSPIYKSPQVDNGYDISDYYDISKDFGTMNDMDALLSEVHSSGMKVLMDLVVNHTSDQHEWFLESAASKTNPKRDWYIWHKGSGVNGDQPPNNWRAAFQGSAWTRHPATSEYYLHLFAIQQPDLNWKNPEVRAAVFKLMNFWLDRGVDGFRMDVINYIDKEDGFPNAPITDSREFLQSPRIHITDKPRVTDYLREMYEKVFEWRPEVKMTVGECPDSTIESASQYTNPANKNLQMIFHFQHVSLRSKIPGKSYDFVEFKKIWANWDAKLNANNGWNSIYFSNHDSPRTTSRFGSDKTEALRSASAKCFGTALLTHRATAYMYQGEELGMVNIGDKFNIEDYQDISTVNQQISRFAPTTRLRCPPNGGFTTGKPWLKMNPTYQTINAELQLSDPDSVFHHFKALIELRKQHEIITYGDYTVLTLEHPTLWVYLRRLDDEALLVVCNVSEEDGTVIVGEWGDVEVVAIRVSNMVI
ncbi:hypothetical protein SmJEL517_g06035 [Synchytrium microbalum]|uniref:Glycosyl hydrolase family 13 catalytic domain-containing protein n=1 Tax=Synchytrium microbalum TaxID=1806994 RepID=A0A507BYN8_9FUNG|nr:uncharacterized protein SmJEL517_g06035 [Synchytrium microbalum]TPX30383.1 hypothetical protein SmJEL517_g06035 [Synchytrium microbalum]